MAKRNLYSRANLLEYYERELKYCVEKSLASPGMKDYYVGKADGIRYALQLLGDKV